MLLVELFRQKVVGREKESGRRQMAKIRLKSLVGFKEALGVKSIDSLKQSCKWSFTRSTRERELDNRLGGKNIALLPFT